MFAGCCLSTWSLLNALQLQEVFLEHAYSQHPNHPTIAYNKQGWRDWARSRLLFSRFFCLLLTLLFFSFDSRFYLCCCSAVLRLGDTIQGFKLQA